MARIICISALVLLAGGVACMQPAASGSAGDWAEIIALENQAKVIAKTSGCSSDAQCRSAPVGNRACGGPRYYIAYCAATTDSAALFRKLDEVKAAEDAYNRKYGLASTCEFRMPPDVGLVNGVCATK